MFSWEIRVSMLLNRSVSMETEDLEEMERYDGKSANGFRKDSSPKVVSCLDLNCEHDESLTSDYVTEKESQSHYIPIRRNSRYYRSFRLRNRGKWRSNKEIQTEHVEGK
uniref:Uncharacterized protein n=1 Tax=Sphaerodactylus townsendi TaxID=933632 RepID=A0ACB8FAH0_9SAUR